MKSLLLSCLTIPAIAFATTVNFKDGMIHELEFLHNVFEARYAPAEWKKKCANWDLDLEIARAKAAVNSPSTTTIKDYQRILQHFCNSTGDYHVGVIFYSTEAALLPFDVAGAEGKYFITAINRERLPQRSFPFEIGDELVLFDGKPTADVVRDLALSELANTGSPTDRAYAEIYLTYRTAQLGHKVPQGPLSVTVQAQKTGVVSTYQIIWEYSPERIKNPALSPLGPELSLEGYAQRGRLTEHRFFNRQMVAPLWGQGIQKPIALDAHPNEFGARESFIPELGRILWRCDEKCPFYAYVFRHPDTQRPIGYLRIPHYSGGGEEEVRQFADCITQLERRSEALVIDQVNNPGGSAFYLYALASMLSKQPLMTPRHRMTITQEDVYDALWSQAYLEQIRNDQDARELLGETICGYPINYQVAQFMLHFSRFIIDEWNGGRRLTAPWFLCGVDYINSHPTVRYTKPILVLINQLDISGGDFLPAILQDNKRATLFGERTAGAGGYIDACRYPNLFGVKLIHYTGSIAERLEGNPIENLGVTPDIPYVLTRKDLESNYTGYVRAVLNAVNDLLKK